MDTAAAPGAPLASVDMGSNSFRLEIAQVAQGQYQRLEYLKETVRLGAGLDPEGRLLPDAMAATMPCLQRFAQRLSDFQLPQVRVVATQTLREASNRDEFLRMAQQALGFPVEVISGREEARLIYAGVAHLQPGKEARLVVDIGGRSTEMILGKGRRSHAAESFAVGCVSLSLRYFPDGRITADGLRQAQIAAGAQLEEGRATFRRPLWRRAWGASGTSGAVAQVLRASGVTDGRITIDALQWCMRHCLEVGDVQALELPGLPAERRAVLPGGLAILYTVLTHFNIDELLPAKGALRQGVIVDLHERREAWRQPQQGDPRDASITRLQRLFEVDSRHAERVAQVALALFDALMPAADAEARRELRWACCLHESGLMVSHHDHHRHCAYLLTNADVPGFSHNQQERLAQLTLAQRGGLSKVDALLNHPSSAAQVLALRLAVIQCHGRDPNTPTAWRLRRRNGLVHLAWPPMWGIHHPRTLHLLREEAAVWAGSSLPLALEA